MNKPLLEIEGFDELTKILKTLPDKVKRKELIGIIREVAKPTLEQAKRVVPVRNNPPPKVKKAGYKVPGNLKRSLGLITGKKGLSKINAVVHVGARAGKNLVNDGWYAHIVHNGRIMHHSKTDKKYRRLFRSEYNKGSREILGSFLSGRASYIKGNPFLTIAYQMTKGQVTAAFSSKVARYIQKRIDNYYSV